MDIVEPEPADRIQGMMTKNLTNIKGLSEAKVMKIKEAASKLKATGFVSVKPLSNARDHRFSALSSRSEDDQVGVGLYKESRKDQLRHHRLLLEGCDHINT